MSQVRLPQAIPLAPCVYSFWSTADQRCLYVGKAGTNPGDRIKSHFDQRKPWALTADVIRLERLPLGTPTVVLDEAERARIHQLTPRGNQVNNWGHTDWVWAARVERDAYRAAKARVPWALSWRLAKVWARSLTRSVARTLAWVAIVDVVLVLAWTLLR
jgi:excinuclease UvrABC nuclease subunit